MDGLIIVAVGSLVATTILACAAWRRLRGTRVIFCHEVYGRAIVEMGALSTVLPRLSGRGRPSVRHCSRWPAYRSCDRSCADELADAPLAEDVRRSWFARQTCSLCGRSVDRWRDRLDPPALLAPNGSTHHWKDVSEDARLWTYRPVCFGCHIDRTFDRIFPGGRGDPQAGNRRGLPG